MCVLVSNAHNQYLLSLQWFVNNFGVFTVCNCDEERSVSPHCTNDGICQCKPGASGRRCDSCLPGYTWRGNGTGCTGELVPHFYSVYTTVQVLIKLNQSTLDHIVLSEKMCDEENLICRNGGTCINFQRCMCPDTFTGM